jgi:hypothetical protein
VRQAHALLEKYNVAIILLDKTLALKAPPVLSLSTSPQWKLVHLDDKSLMFLKDVPRFLKIIRDSEYEWQLEALEP